MYTLPTINIALADDHILIRDAIANLVHTQLSGINVCITAEHGKELLEKIDRAEQKPDICLLDITMPVMDGLETMLHLKNKYPEIKGFALTQNDADHVILTMLKNGASGYMMKNIYPHEFEAAIIEMYTKGFYYSKEVRQKFPKISPTNMDRYFKQLLSPQQMRFLSLCCSSLTYEQIGRKMNIARKTAEHYAEKIGEKIGLHKRIDLALYAQRMGVGRFEQ